MTEYLHKRPLLRIGIVIIAGIAVGGCADIPLSVSLSGHYWAVSSLACGAMLLLLLLSALLRRATAVASLLTIAAAFSFGFFLITHAKPPTTPPHGEDRGDAGLRSRISATYREHGLEGEEYAIVAAMTLGERQRVSHETRQYYNISGAGHVFALSGLHLGIIFILLSYVLPTVRWPFTSTAIQLSALWGYVLLVGSFASILRAAIMLTVYALCRLATRRADPVSVLVIAALLLLVVNPYWLFDIGFQMSFAAVLFIIIVCPPIRESVPVTWPRIARRFIDLVAVSFAAGLGTAPLIALYFHRISLYSLLSNFVVGPCALLIIALTLLLLLATFAPPVAGIIASLLSSTVHCLNSYLAWVASLPHSHIDGISISPAQAAILYVIIATLLGMAHCLLKGFVYMKWRRMQ